MRFRLVDRIDRWAVQESIDGAKAVSFEEVELRKELGLSPALPETLLIESLFQLANWLITLSTGYEKVGLILNVRRIKMTRPAQPGEVVHLHVDWRATREEAALFDGWCEASGERILEGTGCMAYLADLRDFDSEADLRVLFEEIAPSCEAPPLRGGCHV